MMGVTGTLLLIMIQATLAEYHGKNRAVPLTESNIVASVLAGIAPLLVGLGAQTLFGWRTVMVCAIVYGLVLFLLYFRHTQIPPNRAVQNNSEKPTGKLPKAFWAYWLVLFFGVGVEWCLAFWGATYLETVLEFAKDEAAYIMGLFLFVFVVARFGFSRLTRFYSVKLLLWVAIACTTVGFLGFWLLRIPYLNVVGLVVAGLGVANLFPLGLSLASDIGSEQANVASARVSLAAGLAIFIMPQILGILADQVGIQLAYSVVPILLLLVAIMIFLANRVLQ
jgi:fucose permease